MYNNINNLSLSLFLPKEIARIIFYLFYIFYYNSIDHKEKQYKEIIENDIKSLCPDRTKSLKTSFFIPDLQNKFLFHPISALKVFPRVPKDFTFMLPIMRSFSDSKGFLFLILLYFLILYKNKSYFNFYTN